MMKRYVAKTNPSIKLSAMTIGSDIVVMTDSFRAAERFFHDDYAVVFDNPANEIVVFMTKFEFQNYYKPENTLEGEAKEAKLKELAEWYHRAWQEYSPERVKDNEYGTSGLTKYCHEMRRQTYAMGKDFGLDEYEVEAAIRKLRWWDEKEEQADEPKEVMCCQ